MSPGAGRLSLAARWLAGALLLLCALVAPNARAAEGPTIEAFIRAGCPHCEEAEAFLARVAAEQPQLRIVVSDVQREPAALERLQQLARETGATDVRVPAIFVGGRLIVGYSAQAGTDRAIRAALAGRDDRPTAAVGDSCALDDGLACRPAAETERFEIDFFGRTLTLDQIGLPAFTLAIGLLDGFNPCSMWVLLLMISLLAPMNDRPRMLAIAGTFVAVQGVAYFAFLAAWLNLFLLIGLSRASQVAIAAIAIAAGLIHLKDFVAFGRGISLSIPASAKPGIYQRMRAILSARDITAALIGTVILGLLVQVVEFMCTSGFPALFARILTLQPLERASYYGYLLLYIAAYMLDDLIVLGAGVVMLTRRRLQEREGRWLKLASGAVMIGLGVYLLAAR